MTELEAVHKWLAFLDESEVSLEIVYYLIWSEIFKNIYEATELTMNITTQKIEMVKRSLETCRSISHTMILERFVSEFYASTNSFFYHNFVRFMVVVW